MKPTFFLLFLALLQVRVSKAQSVVERLHEADSVLYNPFSIRLVSDTAYNRLIYRNIIDIGGLNVKQGRALGSSLTVDDKGGTLNVGFRPIKRTDAHKVPRIALQGTIKATADDGLITLFSGGEYQKTLGVGGGGLFFLPKGPESLLRKAPSTYRERTKKELQWQYWQLRKQDTSAWHHAYHPQMRPTWRDSSKRAICEFVRLWNELQKKPWAQSYYNGDFLRYPLPAWAQSKRNQAFMLDYLSAEHAVLVFLPAEWDGWGTLNESKWVKANFPDITACQTGDFSKATNLLTQVWQTKVARKLQVASLARIDVLQDSVGWTSLHFSWLSVSGLWNTVQQPIFNATAGAAGFADKVRDNYWSGQLGYNWLRVGQISNWYWNIGLTGEYRRVFDPNKLQTYEKVSWQHTGKDSVLVVDQTKLYPQDPGQKLTLGLLLGGTYYHHGLVTWGVEANFNRKWMNTQQSIFTLGVFTPVKAGDASILLMPLVRWDNQGIPHHWTVGVSLTTSIPGFVKTKSSQKKEN